MVTAVSTHHFTIVTMLTLVSLLTGAWAHHGAVIILGGASKLYLHQLATSPLLSSMELGTDHFYQTFTHSWPSEIQSACLIYNQVKNSPKGQ